MGRPADKYHEEGKHMHQTNLQWVLSGTEAVRTGLVEGSAGSKRVPSTMEGFECRDNIWQQYRR